MSVSGESIITYAIIVSITEILNVALDTDNLETTAALAAIDPAANAAIEHLTPLERLHQTDVHEDKHRLELGDARTLLVLETDRAHRIATNTRRNRCIRHEVGIIPGAMYGHVLGALLVGVLQHRKTIVLQS